MAKTCNSCGADKENASISYAVYEAEQDRAERREKRLVRIIALLIVLLVGSNFAWLVYENSFEDVVTSEEIIIDAKQDGSGTNIVGGGDVDYGTNG